MFPQRLIQGLTVSVAALALGSGLAMAQPDAAGQPGLSGGLVGEAAAQLAARSDVFQATTASLNVVPARLAGGCPQSYAFNVRLGAQSPDTLSYRIVTEDGRQSQLFRARTAATSDGLFMAQETHELMLTYGEDGEPDPRRVVFTAPERPAPAAEPAEPTFFQRVFGTGDAAQEQDGQGLRELAFRVVVVAPNEVVSAFDSHSVSCEPEQETRIAPAAEDQRDGDRGGRDGGGRDDGGRDGGRGRR